MLPHGAEIRDHLAMQLHIPRIQIDVAATGLIQGIRRFAEDVELELFCRLIADAHGFGIFVAAQPGNLRFRNLTLAPQAIQDLHLRGFAADGAHQPLLPCRGFVAVARIHQR